MSNNNIAVCIRASSSQKPIATMVALSGVLCRYTEGRRPPGKCQGPTTGALAYRVDAVVGGVGSRSSSFNIEVAPAKIHTVGLAYATPLLCSTFVMH